VGTAPVRSLFIYWKVPAAQAAAVAATARRWQASLRRAHPGLEATMFQRSDAAGPDGRVTLMETLAMPRAGGVPPALDAMLLAAGDDALAAFGAPQRHVEVFDALPG